MVEAGDGEHPDPVKPDCHSQREKAGFYPECCKADHVQENERDASGEFYCLGACTDGVGAFRKIVGVQRAENIKQGILRARQ